ncbi:hypothetical protein MRX96_000027 [Rhipicephalus microplus]
MFARMKHVGEAKHSFHSPAGGPIQHPEMTYRPFPRGLGAAFIELQIEELWKDGNWQASIVPITSGCTPQQIEWRSRSTERAWGSSASQPLSTSRLGHVSSGLTRSCSRTPTTSNSKRPTLSWADKARGRRESPKGDESNRGSPHASELDEMR